MRPVAGILTLLIAASVMLSGCANLGVTTGGGAEMAQTPITEHPSGNNHPGRFVWHDLITHDLSTAGRFYQELFGWEVEYHDRYAIVRNGNKLIAGILQIEPPEGKARDGVWIPTVSVEDVDATVDRVKANGGTVLKGPLDMVERGRAAMIRDTQGAELVLLKAKNGDPAEAEAGIGDWLWDEIWTRDPEKTGTFYQSVLGYEERVFGERYRVFVSDDEWRSGVRHIGDENQHQLWVPVVRVADPVATIQRVETLGGVVWISPDEAPSRGDTALIADTTGALLLIQRWPPQAQAGGQ